MANAVRGELSFDAGDQTYTLVLDFNALCALEEEFGVDAEKIGEVVGGRAGNIRKVFRIALSEHHPAMTDKAAGSLIHQIGPAKAGELITEAFSRSFPEAAAGTARPPIGALQRKAS